MLRLIGSDGVKEYSWELKPGAYVLGRDSLCDFPVPDKTISRRHARLEIPEGAEFIYVEDLNSHNGTQLNGSRITTRVEAKLGDQISFGRIDFRLYDRDVSATASKGAVTAQLADQEPAKSVVLTFDDARKPLPEKLSEMPELIPTLLEMAKTQVSREPQEQMLRHSLELISRVIPAERLAILFVSDDHSQPEIGASLLPYGRDPGTFTLSTSIVKEIMTNKHSILIVDPLSDERFAKQDSIISSNLNSAMAAPLFDEGKVLGILYVDTTSPLQRYNDEYLRVLAAFGNTIASKLLNYSLIEERHQREALRSELMRAAAIQENLLIDTPPSLSGFEIAVFQEQSRAVGGDMYDITVLPDGRSVFLVADVSGKGMGAALLMSNILASFRILFNDSFDLLSAVKQVSNQLLAHSAPDSFATLFIGELNPSSNSLRYINAGHNPPLVPRSDGSIETLEPSGIMIGAMDYDSWASDKVTLNPGDILYVFTDGVTEAEREDGDQYGDSRLERAVKEFDNNSAKALNSKIMDEITRFVQGAPQSDDITMLSLKRLA